MVVFPHRSSVLTGETHRFSKLSLGMYMNSPILEIDSRLLVMPHDQPCLKATFFVFCFLDFIDCD